MFYFFLSLFLFTSSFCNAFDYELTVCAIFNQDDLPYLKEWVDFHKKQGVEHFWLYNNCCEGPVDLSIFDQDPCVSMMDWRYPSKNLSEWGSIQCNAYNHCMKLISGRVHWCAIIDTDEFLFAPSGDSLINVINKYDDYSGVVVNWVFYGTSFINVPLDQSLTDHLLLRAPIQFNGNKTVKSIVKPKFVDYFLNPHACKYKVGLAVDEAYRFVSTYESTDVSVNYLRINHYWGRDEAFFHNKKLARRQKWHDDIYRCIDMNNKILNLEFDDIIKNFN